MFSDNSLRYQFNHQQRQEPSAARREAAPEEATAANTSQDEDADAY